MRLGNFRIGQPLDDLHRGRRALRFTQRADVQQLTALCPGLVDGIAHPQAEQAVARAKMMVDERQRRANREGVQPQRHLGQFHRHRVLVHAIDAAL